MMSRRIQRHEKGDPTKARWSKTRSCRGLFDQWSICPLSQHRLPTSGLLIGSNAVSPSATVRDLGVFIDQDLTMKTHVQQTSSRCFATLRQLRSIRRCIPTSVFHSVVSALVLSRLDYCNSLLIDLPLTHIQRLQSVQNAAARLIFNLRRCNHITDALIGCACRSELHARWRR